VESKKDVFKQEKQKLLAYINCDGFEIFLRKHGNNGSSMYSVISTSENNLLKDIDVRTNFFNMDKNEAALKFESLQERYMSDIKLKVRSL
jgi:hypothetical protein